jgi:HAE1 family hydrophobic/amphiphilic exporter-1
MATCAVTVFGALAVQRLPVDLLPDLSYPTLTVQSTWADASPVSVERFLTRPLEEAVGVVPGVRSMRSTSRAGTSEVVLEFDWDEPMELAALDVREKAGLVELPEGADLPRVLRYDPSLDPVVRLALSGPRGLDDLRQLAERWLKPRLEAVQGVAAAKVRGGLEPEVQVEADADRLAAFGLTLDDLARALEAENVDQPGGTLTDMGAVYLVRTLHEFEDLGQVRRTVVKELPQGRVRIEDVADVRRGSRDRSEVTRARGAETVELALYREGSANTVVVSAAIQEALAVLRGELDPALGLTVLTDRSRYVSDAVGQVWSAALLGGALAVCVLFFFLRDPASTGIVALTIPLSVVATFLPMQQAGVSLNIMSLGGLALGVGMLVDNSIVVLEAIDRRRRLGLSRRQAAGQGASEVAGAVVAATLTTVSVFLPIVFVLGVAGQLFYDLAVTVCLSLLASLALSLTLIPALASLDGGAILRRPQATLFPWDQGGTDDDLPGTLRLVGWELAPVGNGVHPLSRLLTWVLLPPRLALALVLALVAAGWRLWAWTFQTALWPATRAYDAVARVYPGLLRRALRWRALVLPLTFLLLLLTVISLPLLGADLVPDLAQGEFAFRLTLPEGTPLDTTTTVVERVEARLLDDARFQSVFSLAGSLPSTASGRRTLGENLAQIDLVLPPDADALAEADAVAHVRRVLAAFPQVEADLVRPQVINLDSPVEVRVFADDLQALEQATAQVAERLRALPGLRDVTTTSEPGSPEVTVELDRERAGALGLRALGVGESLRRQLHGEVVGRFREGEERIDIRVRAQERFRGRAAAVANLRVRLPDGTTVPISALAQVTVGQGPAAIHRADGSRVARVSAQLAGADLGETLQAVQHELSRLALPPGVVAESGGQDAELQRSFSSLRLALGLAVFLVFVVMAVQFESLLHPFVILLAVPLGLVGVVAALLLTGTPLGVLSLIGTVMLAGIVVNNAIVLVDAVNRRRGAGEVLDEALVGAGGERLRPILMTTITTVLALLPMALGLGAGDELRRPLAVAVIGGLLGATALTLVVVPCLYRVLSPSGEAEGGQP